MTDRKLEETILGLLAERGAGKTICPSEAARAVAGSDERQQWEHLMEPAREAAQRLVAKEKIVITQRGHIVDGSTAKGPIRLRLR
jgi:nucleoid-associated protein YgaU